MKVLVDLTYILPDYVTGVANYAFRLLQGIEKCNRQNSFVLLLTSENKDWVTKHLPQYEIAIYDSKPIPYIRGWLNQRKIDKLIRELRISIFFSPYISHSGLYTTSVPFVGVLHDAQGFQLMKTPFKQFLYNVFTKHILNKTVRLVTISEYSKKDIQCKLRKFTTPITVIYNSLETGCVKSIQKRTNKKPYILNVNTLEPYKNLITLVKAFSLIKDIIPHQLIVKASVLPYWYEVIEPYLIEHGLETRVQLITDKFSELEMANLYCNADLFVSPSLLEGFGYTPIEAALYQIPVICSKESALYETTMGLLNYYEPATDVIALKNAILYVLENPPVNRNNIAQKFAKMYSQEKQALNFIHLFDSV